MSPVPANLAPLTREHSSTYLAQRQVTEEDPWAWPSRTPCELGTAYLGTQGDPWDAQKDMAPAGLGALVTVTLVAVVNAWLPRDFAVRDAEASTAESILRTGGRRSR